MANGLLFLFSLLLRTILHSALCCCSGDGHGFGALHQMGGSVSLWPRRCVITTRCRTLSHGPAAGRMARGEKEGEGERRGGRGGSAAEIRRVYSLFGEGEGQKEAALAGWLEEVGYTGDSVGK